MRDMEIRYKAAEMEMRHKVLWKSNKKLVPASSDLIAILSIRYQMSIIVIIILRTALGTVADLTSKQTSNQTSKNKYITKSAVVEKNTTRYSEQKVITIIHILRHTGVA